MKKIKIENIKNVKHLEFIIPNPGVHIVTGKNGVGKTTLFTCISRICNKNAYRQGFPSYKESESKYDLFTGTIEYSFNGQSVTYSRRESGEWRPNNKTTKLDIFGYPSVKNIKTNSERIFTQQDLKPRRGKPRDQELNDTLDRVFKTERFKEMIQITTGDLRRGRAVKSDERRRNIAHLIPLTSGKYYTEQNFSFGEIVLLNLLLEIKNVENGSIVLIDELEMALHPSAQIELISVLREIATKKELTIIISTHSSSIIRAQKSVILLEVDDSNGETKILYDCPSAKAIGAIGLREDTMPDIVLLVEDDMAKSFLNSLIQKYIELTRFGRDLDIRILKVGGYENVISFYDESKNYVFYSNVYLAAFMDKDVETDIIPYFQYHGAKNMFEVYRRMKKFLHFLPFTPEILLYKVLEECYNDIIVPLRDEYLNQQIDYTIENVDMDDYFDPLPVFTNQNDYNSCIDKRGKIRKTCKEHVEQAVVEIAKQIHETKEKIYRFLFDKAVEKYKTINPRELLGDTMKRKS